MQIARCKAASTAVPVLLLVPHGMLHLFLGSSSARDFQVRLLTSDYGSGISLAIEDPW